MSTSSQSQNFYRSVNQLSPDAVAEINRRLNAVEQENNVKILFACESGSRCWGFASPDSDYDVRFIYIRPLESYLSLEQPRDVIETPLEDVWDVNGWDLIKTLRLMKKGNSAVCGWLDSPIIYRAHMPFLQDMRKLYQSVPLDRIHAAFKGLAKAQHDKFFKNVEQPRYKKYFYLLQGLMSMQWVEDNNGVPPVEFASLLKDCIHDAGLKKEIARLLELKKSAPESACGPVSEFPQVQQYVKEMFARQWLELPADLDQTAFDKVFRFWIQHPSSSASAFD